jgi:hypothetical protein
VVVEAHEQERGARELSKRPCALEGISEYGENRRSAFLPFVWTKPAKKVLRKISKIRNLAVRAHQRPSEVRRYFGCLSTTYITMPAIGL